MSDRQVFWFAARTRKDQEFAVRDALIKLNIEHYLPTQTVVRQLKYRKKKVEVPVIRNLIFVRATKDVACALANEYGIRLFYMRDFVTHSMLIVPEKQMRDFMFVMDIDPNGTCLDNEVLEVGEKVRVVKGKFEGVEGELVSMANGLYVIIRIPQVLSVSVRIPKSHLKKI